MMKVNLAAWALRHRSIIYYFMAILFTFGTFSFVNMGRMEDPSFTIRTMVIGVAWPGATPEKMASQVTDKLEDQLRDLPGIDYTKSFSTGEKAVIYVNLKDSLPSSQVRAKWVEARNLITDKWSDLPSGVQGPVINDHFSDVYGSIYAVTGEGYSYEELRAQAESIRRSLLTVPDVSRAILVGNQTQTLYITINRDKLAAYHVSYQSVLTAIKQQSTMVPSGMVDTTTNNVYIRVNGLFDSVEAIQNMELNINNNIVRIGDIATVTDDYSSPQNPLFFFNGKPAVGIAVSMVEGGNNLTLGKNLDAKLASIQSYIPAGITLSQVSNQPEVVKASISDFSDALFEAIIIVLIVSFFALGIRSGIVVALTIPVVVASTFVAMYADSIDLDKVSLGALIISLGLLVDDAIIVVEMMTVKLEEGMERMEAAAFAYKATAFPMLSGTLITCSGFLPVYLSKGMVAEFTHSLFLVVTMALLLSWLASVMVSPVLAYSIIRLKPENPESFKSKLKHQFYQIFETILHWFLDHRKTVLVSTVILFLLALAGMPYIKQEFFPPSTRPELMVSVRFPQQASLAYTKTQSDAFSDFLSGNQHIDHYSAHVGEGAPRFVLTLDPEVAQNNFMQFVVVAKSTQDRNDLYKDIDNKLSELFPDATHTIQYIQTGPPSKYPIMLRVSGKDPQKLTEIAQRVKAELQKYTDVSDIHFDWPDNSVTARVVIDQAQAQRLGINPYSAAVTLQSSITGINVGEYYDGTQTIPIKYKLDGQEQHNLGLLQSIPIQTASNTYVPLSQIATIRVDDESGVIWHRSMQPTITIGASVPPTVLSNAITSEVYKNLKDYRNSLPEGYTIELDGSTERSQIALQNLAVPLPIMIVSIMTILMFQLKKIPLMIMAILTAPLGLIGVVAAMLITGTPMGFMAVLGVIALSGMIIRNSIILLDQIEIHIAENQSPREAIINSATLRFRPIMLTALAAILGMVPLMRSVFWAPLAIGFSGGLLVATILTLLVLPVMYATWYKVK